VDVATAYLRAGRYDEALEAATRAIGLDRDYARAHSTLGWAHFGKGQFAVGLAAMEHAVKLAPGDSLWLGQLGEAYALAGKVDLAEGTLRELQEAARRRYVAPYHLAYVYTGLGQHDRAMDCLEQAFEQRAGSVYGIRGSFLFAPLRGNPRFTALLRRMNLA
jgi:adenylate cyclase